MNYREAMDYIRQAACYGIVPGLDGIRELCKRLGDPQKDLEFVHIAGTNGKGSVSAFISSVLQCGGYRVGRYISPTLFEYRERIQVNGRPITKTALCRHMEQVKAACGEMVEAGMPHPTPFEMETALGFLYCKEKQCDIVVLETGMGGLLDATNVVENTLVAVITSISMDHMNFLGSTLEEIAAQKAGIIKAGCRVAVLDQSREVMGIIGKWAAEKGCPVTAARREDASHVHYGLEKQWFDYGGNRTEITLAGKYQIDNAVLALAALEALDVRFPVAPEKRREGMLKAAWPGRFTVIGKKPWVVVDGAHNEDAARRLSQSVEYYFKGKRIIYIMGVLRDKEYGKIISLTHSHADQIITVTPPDNSRALSAYELAQEVAKVHPAVTAADSLEEAAEVARLLAGKEDVILAFGSLSFLGKLMNLFC